MSNPYPGVSDPQANYTKVPNIILANLAGFDTKAEVTVVLYITRHTWGYHENERRISQNEFEHGRKHAQRYLKRHPNAPARLDTGVGMTRKSIKDGLRRAEAHGFIVVEEEGDLGRLERYYALRHEGEPLTNVLQGDDDQEDRGKDYPSPGVETTHVMGKNYPPIIERNLERNSSKESHYVAPAAKPPIQATFEPEVYDEGLYRGLVVRMVEDGEETFDCPACEERQKWPSRKSRRNFQCSACHEPLAGFLPDDAEPFWKPPKRPLERKDLGTLVPGIAAHLANVPYRTQDKERLLHAMREDSNQMAKCLDWAYRQQMPAHVLVKNALTAYYKPQTVVKHAQREVAKSVKSNLAAGDPGQSPTMSSAYDF